MPPTPKTPDPLTANEKRAILLVTGYRRLVHPVTGRFMGEFDPKRRLLKVVDRGKTAIIDLNDIE